MYSQIYHAENFLDSLSIFFDRYEDFLIICLTREMSMKRVFSN